MVFAEPALVGGDLRERHAEDLRRGRLVHVPVFRECGEQAFVARQVRHDPQLDLRVVGRQQHVARRRDERLPDAAALRHGGSECSAGWDRRKKACPVCATAW